MFSVFELYEYARRVRRRFAQKLAELDWAEVERNREASFYSMKNILLHMVDNEDWMVNYVVAGRPQEYVRRRWSEYRSMGEVFAHMDEVEAKTQAYLSRADEEELKRRVKLTLQSGEEFELSVEECILQTFTEQLYHMGELIALLWQMQVEPPPMQWFYNNPRAKTQTK